MYLTVQLTALQAFNLCSEGIQIDDNLLQFPIIYLTNILFYIYNVHLKNARTSFEFLSKFHDTDI